jgi:hypothetical protein
MPWRSELANHIACDPIGKKSSMGLCILEQINYRPPAPANAAILEAAIGE